MKKDIGEKVSEQLSGRVLYIMYDGLTDPLGQSQVLPYLIGLKKKNPELEIDILSCDKKFKLKRRKKLIAEICAENNIHWKYVYFRNKIPGISPLMNLTALLYTAFWMFLIPRIRRLKNPKNLNTNKRSYSILHCRSQPAAEIGFTLRKLFSFKFIYDMRGFWADEKFESKNEYSKHPIYNWLKKREKKLIMTADEIIILTQAAKKIIINSNNKLSQKKNITVIPCCADFNHFNFNNIEEPSQKLLIRKILPPEALNEKYTTLLYIGSLGTCYGLFEMLIFHKMMNDVWIKKGLGKVFFLILTQDSFNHHLDLIQKSHPGIDFPADLFLSFEVERKDVPLYMSLADVAIYFIEPTFAKKASSPTKLAEILGMGIPVITNTGIGDVDDFFSKNNVGFPVNDFSPDSFITGIKYLEEELFKINNSEKTNKEGSISTEISPESIREAGLRYFSLENGVDEYETVYRRSI